MSSHKESIKKKIQLSYFSIIVIMIIPTIYSVTVSNMHSKQYDYIITNVSRANHLNQIVKTDITDEVWDIVAGKKEFTQGRQYEILRSIRNGISDMMSSTSNARNRQLLEVVSRAEKTLEMYVDRLGEQISNNASVAETEDTLDEIRGVSALMSNILQDFIVAEIESASETNESIKKSSLTLTVIQLIITLVVMGIAVYGFISVSENIRKPIYDMKVLSSRIAEGDLSARVALPHVEELDPLAENLNTMAGKINGLINENIQEHKNLQKAEMRALQAQITPHFLYNTLANISVMAEEGMNREIIHMSDNVSAILRYISEESPSGVTLGTEVAYTIKYLECISLRYGEGFSYSFDIPSEMEDLIIPKLLIQPVVENCISHGFHNRPPWHIHVAGVCNAERFTLTITDNGIGFEPAYLMQFGLFLAEKRESKTISPLKIGGMGLKNIFYRLQLFYDREGDLSIGNPKEGGGQVILSGKVIRLETTHE